MGYSMKLEITKIMVKELPETCFDCPLSASRKDGSGSCTITKAVFYPAKITYRIAHCPLMTQEQIADWLFFTQDSTKMIRLAFDMSTNFDRAIIKEYIEKIKHGDRIGVVNW